MKGVFAFLVVTLLIFGCSSSDHCEENSCFTSPPATIFEILDEDSGGNLYTNGTLNSTDIKLVDENNKNIDFQLFSEKDSSYLYLDVGWETGFKSYRLILNSSIEIQFNLFSEIKAEGCCSFYQINNFSITNYRFNQSEITGNYLVFID